jgi:hypothetical protein
MAPPRRLPGRQGAPVPGPMPLPDGLPPALRAQDARGLGLSRDVLRGRRFVHLGRDLYVPASLMPLPLLERCRALASVTPDDATFSHVTAGRLHGLPIPAWLEASDALHVSRARDDIPPTRLGVVSHEVELPAEHVVRRHGLRVTSPARTFLDLANELRLAELVALGDVVVGQQLATRDQLARLVAWARGRRGVAVARRALPLLDGRAESPPESMVRVWLTVCGLPPMVPQLHVRDRRGREIARVDLGNERYRVVGEYEGAYHRDREQFARDVARRTALVDAGWDVVQVEADVLGEPGTVVRRFVTAFRRAGWTGPYSLAGLAR